MAAVLSDDMNEELIMATTDVNVPLILEPSTTAPVYFNGSLAAIPYTQFWYIPPATDQFKETTISNKYQWIKCQTYYSKWPLRSLWSRRTLLATRRNWSWLRQQWLQTPKPRQWCWRQFASSDCRPFAQKCSASWTTGWESGRRIQGMQWNYPDARTPSQCNRRTVYNPQSTVYRTNDWLVFFHTKFAFLKYLLP